MSHACKIEIAPFPTDMTMSAKQRAQILPIKLGMDLLTISIKVYLLILTSNLYLFFFHGWKNFHKITRSGFYTILHHGCWLSTIYHRLNDKLSSDWRPNMKHFSSSAPWCWDGATQVLLVAIRTNQSQSTAGSRVFTRHITTCWDSILYSYPTHICIWNVIFSLLN